MPSRSISETPWGFNVPPLPDELASSWLVRIAQTYMLSPHTLTRMILGNVAVWNRDLDSSLAKKHLKQIGYRVSVDAATALETSLAPWRGQLQPKQRPPGFLAGVLRVGVYHRLRRRHGLQYCPDCLREDRMPYFRRHWRLAFLFGCPRHQCRLLDACSACDAPVMPHRATALDVRRCHDCLENICEPSERLSDGEFSSLTRIIDRWEHDAGRFESRQVPFRTWLAVLRFWYSRLRIGSVNSKLGLRLSRNRPDASDSKIAMLEDSRCAVRRQWLPFIEQALVKHPDGLIELCRSSGVTSTALLSDYRGMIPNWFRQQILTHLEHGPTRVRKSKPMGTKVDSTRTIRKRIGLTEAMQRLALPGSDSPDE